MKIKVAMMSIMICLAMLLSTGALATEMNDQYKIGDTFSLTIMNTHDIHGNMEDIPRYATYVREVEENVENMLLLDGGDTFRRGELEHFRGIMEAEIFNLMGYDACALGNHEFNVPADEKDAQDCNDMIKDIVDANDAPHVCANVVYRDNGEYLDGIEPYIIVERSGVRIGIIGITSMKPANREMAEVTDKDFLNATESLNKCLEELEGQTDINIVLSHAGLVEDLNMGQLGHNDDWTDFGYKIAAIISADDHLVLETPLYFYYGEQKGIPIFQHGGELKNTLGRLDLAFEVTEQGFKLVDFNGYICDVSETEPDAEVQALIDDYYAAAELESAA